LTGAEVGDGTFGPLVAVAVGMGEGVIEAVCEGDGVWLGKKVNVGEGVKLSTAGWKGVGVIVAFGSTVTRLRGGEEAAIFTGRLQETRISVKRKMDSALLCNT
jgi:hypothetical protein